MENELSKYTKLGRNLRQECVLSPDAKLKELGLAGFFFFFCGDNLNNIHCADYMVFLEETERKSLGFLD